jgi:hypothetical protein
MICNTQQKHGIQSQRGSLRRRKQWPHIHRATHFPRSRSVRQREQWLATLGATHSPRTAEEDRTAVVLEEPDCSRESKDTIHYSQGCRCIACPPAHQFNGHCVEQVLSPHECIMLGRSSARGHKFTANSTHLRVFDDANAIA